MKHLSSGQHFGANRRTVKLNGTILTEAGYLPQIEVPWHYHENAYFFYHLRGRLDEINKKKTITCAPGTLLFHHWQDPHYDKNFTADAAFFHIEIENRWFDRHQLKASWLEGSMPLHDPSLKPIFQKIHREIRLEDTITPISVDGLLLQAIASISRLSAYEKNGTPAWVKKVKEILNDSDTEKITLQQLSLETGISPVHLSREFPKYFQVGFGQYLRQKRIEKSISFLQNPELSITEVAYRCGFSDQSHFIRSFKEIMGTTPLKYRFHAGKS
jgi:AraC-like DNA-binding protein